MRTEMQRVLAALGIGAVLASPAAADGPDAASLLGYKPIQADVVYETPARETWARCKVEIVKQDNQSGWIVRDPNGLPLRRFVDTNQDGQVDVFSYYKGGQEVYRDIDSDNNGRADQYRWFHSGGTRWGSDADQDGTIDRWNVISAEEASREVIAAFAANDWKRLERVLVTEGDIRTLGLDEAAAARVRKVLGEAAGKFASVAAQFPKGAEWSRLDADRPMTVPGSDIGAAKDLAVYSQAVIIAENAGKTVLLRCAEIVKVDETWKLIALPSIMEEGQSIVAEGVLVTQPETQAVAAMADAGQIIEEGPEIQKLVAELQQLDQAMPEDPANFKAIINYHLKRADLCASIGSKSQKKKSREHWYRQTADSLNAAVQSGQYPQGITTLNQYADTFAKLDWGQEIAAYYKYRALNAAYAVELSDPKADHMKAQDAFLQNLTKYVADYPAAEDAADALWQLGNGMEFAGKDQAAREYYKKLASEFPKSTFAKKAEGALRRIESVGQPFRLVGNNLAGFEKIDTEALKGKVLVISFWATWCEPCKSEMPRLERLREKFGAQGVEVIGVCLDQDKEAAQVFVQRNKFTYRHIFEPGSLESPPAVEYGVISLPTLMLVDVDGRVLNRNLQYSQLEIEVERAIAKKLATKPD